MSPWTPAQQPSDRAPHPILRPLCLAVMALSATALGACAADPATPTATLIDGGASMTLDQDQDQDQGQGTTSSDTPSTAPDLSDASVEETGPSPSDTQADVSATTDLPPTDEDATSDEVLNDEDSEGNPDATSPDSASQEDVSDDDSGGHSDVVTGEDTPAPSDLPVAVDSGSHDDITGFDDVGTVSDVSTGNDSSVEPDVPTTVDVASDLPPAADVLADIPSVTDTHLDIPVALDVAVEIDVAVEVDLGPAPTTGSVTICVNPTGSGYPSSSYSQLVANGNWSDWNGWGLQLNGPDDEGLYCGTLEALAPGNYEYVHAATGSGDNWSGWGQPGNAPVGSECDAEPTDEWGNFGFTIVAGEQTTVCHGWDSCGCPDTPDPNADTGSVTLCVDTSNTDYPSPGYDQLVANGTWSDWNGWGLLLNVQQGESRYCGTLENLEPGTYEYVHAATGAADSWSGWGQVGNAPVGSACDYYPGDEFGNFAFTITAGTHAELCHGWSSCGCDDGPDDPIDPVDPVDDSVCGSAPGRVPAVSIQGRKVLDGDTPIHLKGVSWAPTPIGQAPGSGGADFSGFVAEDSLLMEGAGINVVKTYGPITDEAVLDTLWSRGIGVLMTVYYGYGQSVDSALDTVCALKDHPAILGWVVGNEWNYNNLGQNITFNEAVATVGEVVAAIQDNDSTRPVSTVYGWLPSPEVLTSLSHVDLWGLNVYSGLSFWDLFDQWEDRSTKPMYLAEYGCDAYNGVAGEVDEGTQATYVEALTAEIHANASVNGSGVCAGGMVFEFSDEWWKYSGGSWSSHDTTASWNNGAYSPDPGMHEEWWGLVDIYRVPREALETYGEMAAPTP